MDREEADINLEKYVDSAWGLLDKAFHSPTEENIARAKKEFGDLSDELMQINNNRILTDKPQKSTAQFPYLWAIGNYAVYALGECSQMEKPKNVTATIERITGLIGKAEPPTNISDPVRDLIFRGGGVEQLHSLRDYVKATYPLPQQATHAAVYQPQKSS